MVPGEKGSELWTADVSHRHIECIASENSLLPLTRKRRISTRSPFKASRSPIPKFKRQARTGTEGKSMASPSSPVQLPDSHSSSSRQRLHDLQVKLSTSEKSAIAQLKKEMDMYTLFNYILSKNDTPEADACILSIQDYMTLVRPVTVRKSNFVYIQVLDAKSENKDTIMTIMFDVHKRFIEQQGKEFLVITADAKLYEVLQSLKHEYGDELGWVLPFPGDWHMLKNFQNALIKPYFDMGLRELARASGYPVAAIQACSQFKRTHRFLIEAWQALYLVMVQRYIEVNKEGDSPFLDFAQNVSLQLQSCDFIATLTQLRETVQVSMYHSNFQYFVNEMANKDINWKFWKQFVFEDMLAYICLYLAIRSGCWELRLASIKLMAPIFTAFDHQTYRKLIAQHLADLQTYPNEVIRTFQEGGFVASLSGRPWHSVALDEAHEMKINKECKTSIVHPSKDYIQRVASYIPYRAKCLENLKGQLFPEEKHLPSVPSSFPEARKTFANIEAQTRLILSTEYLTTTTTSQELCNPFSKKFANAEQQHDLASFREIGQCEFENHVSYYILKEASVHPPIRKKRLLTLTQRKASQRAITQLEKDRRMVQKCLHKKLK